MADIANRGNQETPAVYCKRELRCRARAGGSRRLPPVCLSNRVMAAWMGLAILLLLCADTTLLNEAARFAALPMGAFFLLLLFDNNCCTHGLFLGKRGDARLPALLLTGVFFVTLSLPSLLACPLFSDAGLRRVWWKFGFERYIYLAWNWTGYLLGYAVSVYACLHAALAAFLRPRAPEAEIAPERRVFGLWTSTLPLVPVLLMLLFAAKQSLFIGDAPTVWYHARDNIWNEWHTAGYQLFVKLCALFWNSQRSVVLVQSLACLYAANYAVSLFAARGFPKRAGTAYVAALVISFVPLYFLQAIIKDVAFSFSLLAFTVGVLRLTDDTARRAADWVWTGFFGLCVCLFRHAGAIPVIGALAALLFYFLAHKNRAARGVLLCGGAVALCSVLIVNVLAYRVLGFERNPGYIMYSAPMTMIGAVADSGVTIAPEDKAVMEQIMPVEKWARCYEPYFADTISRPYGRIGDDVQKIESKRLGGALLKLNARFLVRYPAVYLRAFFNLNSLMWEITTPADGYVRGYLGYMDTPIAAFVTEQGYAEDGIDYLGKTLKQPEATTYTGFTALVNRYAEFLYGVPALRDLFWRGGMANLAILLSAVALVKKRRARELIGLVPVACVTLAMLFSMPAQEVRYVFPNLLIAVFYGVYAYYAPKIEAEADISLPAPEPVE